MVEEGEVDKAPDWAISLRTVTVKDLTPTVDVVEEGGMAEGEEEEDMVVVEIETGTMMMMTMREMEGRKERVQKHYLETMKMTVVVDTGIVVNIMVMKAEVTGGGGEGDEGREAEDMAVIVMMVTMEIEKREKAEENKTTGVVRMKKDLRKEMKRDMLTEPVREGIGMKGISPKWNYVKINQSFGQPLGIEFRVYDINSKYRCVFTNTLREEHALEVKPCVMH